MYVVVNAVTETVYGTFQTYTEASIWRDKTPNMHYAMVIKLTSP